MLPNVYGQTEGNKIVVKRVEELAKKRNAKMAQIATAWAMQKDGALSFRTLSLLASYNDFSFNPCVTAPIVGTTSLKNLEELVCAFVIVGISHYSDLRKMVI